MEVLPVAVCIVIRLEDFVASHRLDQRAVAGEVLVRQQCRDFFVLQQRTHEVIEQIALLQSFSMLGTRRASHPTSSGEGHPSVAVRSAPRKTVAAACSSTVRTGPTCALSLNTVCGNRGPGCATPRTPARVWFGAGARADTRCSGAQDENNRPDRQRSAHDRSSVLPTSRGHHTHRVARGFSADC